MTEQLEWPPNVEGEEVLLRPLKTEETFSRLISIFKQRWGLFLGISTLSILITNLVSLLLLFLPVKAYDNSYGYEEYNEDTSGQPDDFFSVIMLALFHLIYYAIVAVSDGALIRATAELYVHNTPTLQGSVLWGLRRIWPLMSSVVLVGVLVGVPMVMLLIPFLAFGLYSVAMLLMMLYFIVMMFLSVVTYHIYPIIMIEGKGPVDAIRGSWHLSEDYRGYIFLCLLLFGLAKFGVVTILQGIGASMGNWSVSLVLNLFYGIVASCLGSILQAVVYFSVRVQKEGLNLESLTQELKISGGTSYTTMDGTPDTSPPVVKKDPQDGEIM